MILSVIEYENMKSELLRTVDRYGLIEVREAVDAIELVANGSVRHKLAYGKLFNENAALTGQLEEARGAIETWHEYWDNRYDGEPLKDYEIKMLKLLGRSV